MAGSHTQTETKLMNCANAFWDASGDRPRLQLTPLLRNWGARTWAQLHSNVVYARCEKKQLTRGGLGKPKAKPW
eukprot:11218990-Lingulodinium_polyedra.AAC.1